MASVNQLIEALDLRTDMGDLTTLASNNVNDPIEYVGKVATLIAEVNFSDLEGDL